jgi:hypothetical protein
LRTTSAILPALIAAAWIPAGCSEDHGSATLVDLGEYAWHMEWASNAQDLLVISGVERTAITSVPEYRTERVTAYPGGSWDTPRVLEVDGHLIDAFSCGDRDSVAVLYAGNQGPPDYNRVLEFREYGTDTVYQEYLLYGYYQRPWSDRTWFPYTYECDVGANVMYMRWEPGKVVALDGSTGEILREFVDLDEPAGGDDGPEFVIQPSSDRLVWTENTHGDSEVRIYRLSTAELVGAIPVTPESAAAPSGYMLLGEDKLVVTTGSLGATCPGTGVRIIDLASAEMETTYCLQYDFLRWARISSIDPPKLLAAVLKWPEDCEAILSMDLTDGSVGEVLDLCAYTSGGFGFYPGRNRVLVTELAPADGRGGYLWWLMTWPELTPVSAGRQRHYYDRSVILPDQDIEALQSHEADSFAAFDFGKGAMLDEFRFCTGVQERALRVDPTGRWATTLCFGDWSGVDAPEDKPRGAGFAVVDLERYSADR